MFLDKINRVHLIGIGGIGMSGIAEFLLKRGYTVSGSDLLQSGVTERLIKNGIKVFYAHSGQNISPDLDLVVYSSAVSKENPEIIRAEELGIKAIKRSKMLKELTRYSDTIGIAGTHGKTTTTSMLGKVFVDAGKDPNILIGGNVPWLRNTNSRNGAGNYFIIEADEYDKTFLDLNPSASVITNVDFEHRDTYSEFSDVKNTFVEFANKIPFYGVVVLCADNPVVMEIRNRITAPSVTYGINKEADFYAEIIERNIFSSKFLVRTKGEILGEISINLSGEHNVSNALAALVLSMYLGIDFDTIAESLSSFKNAARRLEVKYDREILVIDDYAHHPAEIAAVLNGIKASSDRRIIAVFQPHLFSRTSDLYKDFASALSLADMAVVTGIYPAREKPIAGISGKIIHDEMNESESLKIYYEEDKENIPALLKKIYKDDDIIITMGAGDIWRYGSEFVDMIKDEN